ncbi:C2 domain [Trinorchestia longiramus]|nr:C2 domain [Trinorchestia longiramus]
MYPYVHYTSVYSPYAPSYGYYYRSPYYGPYRRSYGRVYNSGSVTTVPTSVVLGPLPDDFLRVSNDDCAAEISDQHVQERTDHEMASQLQIMNRSQPIVGRFQVTVVRATLHKNYGITRMDPYVRLHFGHQVFETHTDQNGAKNPVWNKTFYIYQLPRNFTNFLVEIYDERTLTEDERIAWVTVPLPQNIMRRGIHDRTYNLSGRIGDGLEGTIQIIMSYEKGVVSQSLPAPLVMFGAGPYGHTTPRYAASLPYYELPEMTRGHTTPIHEADVKQVSSMFPSMDMEVVRSVLDAARGNKEIAVENLLAMQQADQ